MRHPTRTMFLVLSTAFAIGGSPAVGAAQAGGDRGNDGGAAAVEVESEGGAAVGRVVAEESGEPLPGATVEIRTRPDSTLVGRGVSGPTGNFYIPGLPTGTYRVMVSYLGYGSPPEAEVEIRSGSTSVLGALLLPVRALDLDPLLVTAEQPAVTFEADRTSYHLDGMPEVAGGTASDALQSIPELDMDIDGQVRLNGASPAIYLNGRPAPMRGEALAIFLEQFSADHIDRVEVMENPSARYSAEGSGGIVNIELREGVELGWSGSVFANGATRGQMGLGARGTLQQGPWTVTAGTSVGYNDRESSSYDLRQNLLVDPTTYLRRDSWSDRSGLNGRADIDVEYEVGERALIWSEARIDGDSGDSDRLSTTTHMDEAQDPRLRYDRFSDSDSRGLSGSVATGFDYEWEPRRHELEVELELQMGRDREGSFEEYLEEQFEEAGGEEFIVPAELSEEWEEESDREATFGLDYSRPLGEEVRMEVGYEAELQDTDQDRRLFLQEDDGGSPIQEETFTGFSHREVFNSLYMTLQRQIGDLGVQAGVRAERADTRFEIPSGESFDNDYVSLFPSANVSYRVDDARRVRLSYSRRINRPSVRVLNPVNRSTDPLERQVGNPDIEPQYTHSVSLNASWSGDLGRLSLSPYFRQSEGDWAQITNVDMDGVATRTWENLSSTRSYGASLNLRLRRGSQLSGGMSISGRREIRDASNLSERYSGSSLRWSSRANVDARLTDDLSATSRFTYSPGQDLPQGRTSDRISGDLGFRYRFMDRRASIRVSLRDPFGLQRTTARSGDVGYLQIGRSSESTRSARINLSYAFGGEGRRRGGRGGR